LTDSGHFAGACRRGILDLENGCFFHPHSAGALQMVNAYDGPAWRQLSFMYQELWLTMEGRNGRWFIFF
jgi:hypothetical protein